MSAAKLPGADWIYVEEGDEYTPEQAARRFLSLSWGHQVKEMQRMLEAQGEASACRMLNHEGAMIFATRHSCPPDRFDEGWRGALEYLDAKLSKPAPKDVPVLDGQVTIDTALGA